VVRILCDETHKNKHHEVMRRWSSGVMRRLEFPITPTLQHSIPIFMNDILNKAMVLVLNRNWQAVNVRTPQEAFCMMATNVAAGLEIEGKITFVPFPGTSGITLPMRPQDNAVQTVRVLSACQR